MPNWVTNEIAFKTPEDCKRVADFMHSEEQDFDFNKLIPMPETLNVPSGSYQYKAMLWYLTDAGTKRVTDEMVKAAQACMDVTRAQEIIDSLIADPEALGELEKVSLQESYFAGNPPTLYEAGQVYAENLRKYSCTDWYHWRLIHWGTKWNACHEGIGDQSIAFDTAWAPPRPIFHALINEFPDIPMRISYAEEQFDLYTGEYIWDGVGNLEENHPDEDTFEAFRLAAYHWDYDQEYHRWDPKRGKIATCWFDGESEEEREYFDSLPLVDLDRDDW